MTYLNVFLYIIDHFSSRRSFGPYLFARLSNKFYYNLIMIWDLFPYLSMLLRAAPLGAAGPLLPSYFIFGTVFDL